MLLKSFIDVYTKFKLHFYKKVFESLQDREASLTTVETFCMEIIYAMNKPTINQFAKLANISSPNAAYKVNNLIKKGYLKKCSPRKIKESFTKEELDLKEKILRLMIEELMPEIPLDK